jgi:hypothetical protein
MRKYPFILNGDEDLILLQAWIDDYEIKLALDTAATHTVIDLNVLLMLDYSLSDARDNLVFLETANGIIESKNFILSRFESIGDKRTSFPVLSYDFLGKGIISPYDGVLGLDFFRILNVLSIDFKNQELWLHIP